MNQEVTTSPLAVFLACIAITTHAFGGEYTAGGAPGDAAADDAMIEVPLLDGKWWRIADDNPDVSPYKYVEDGPSNTCDFTIYRDVKGKWHCVACVRGTDAPVARVFHHWTADRLDQTDWKQEGLMDWPRNTAYGKLKALQAPHCVVHDGRYYCFYNSGSARAMTSPNGIEWSIMKNTDGEETLFRMGRDVNLFHDTAHNRWLAYYCGTAEIDG